VLYNLISLVQKANRYIIQLYAYTLVRSSKLFDKSWYLGQNSDVARAKVDPWLHYLRYGGFEGRDPGPNFSSGKYLNIYPDVKAAQINPLVHYIRYGRAEGRITQPLITEVGPFKCPVCQQNLHKFVSFTSYYVENSKRHLVLHKPEEDACPHCNANNIERLSAIYLREKLPSYNKSKQTVVLDISSSPSLVHLFNDFTLTRHTADLFVENINDQVDLTNISNIASDSCDILICSVSHEQVNDNMHILSELYRVLKTDGWGIIMAPRRLDKDLQIPDKIEHWQHLNQSDHTHLNNNSNLAGLMETTGFVIRQFGIEYFGESAFKQHGITNTSVLYVAEKLRVYEPIKSNDDLLLTIILTTYNHKEYIAKALESVINQITSYPYQIWVCDDCSTDGTLEICQDYANKYPEKIKLFAQRVNTYSNPAMISHIHLAIKNVNTKYWCILDGDDEWCDNQKIQIAMDVLENKPAYVTFAHDTTINDLVNQNQKSLVHEMLNIEIPNPVIFENDKPPFFHISARIHRNVINFSSGIEIHGDIYLFYRYLDKGPLYYYDKIMSIRNYTGKGMWSGLSQAARESLAIIDNYLLNKYLHYKHDDFFTRRAGNPKLLLQLKRYFRAQTSWEIWFVLKKIEALFSKFKNVFS